MGLIARLMSETLTIERPGPPVRDSAGTKVPGPPVQIEVKNCTIMSPYGATVGSTTETQAASMTVETRRVFAAPLGTDVRKTDVIRRGAEKWEVVGDPLELPLTSLARVEAMVRRVTG